MFSVWELANIIIEIGISIPNDTQLALNTVLLRLFIAIINDIKKCCIRINIGFWNRVIPIKNVTGKESKIRGSTMHASILIILKPTGILFFILVSITFTEV